MTRSFSRFLTGAAMFAAPLSLFLGAPLVTAVHAQGAAQPVPPKAPARDTAKSKELPVDGVAGAGGGQGGGVSGGAEAIRRVSAG